MHLKLFFTIPHEPTELYIQPYTVQSELCEAAKYCWNKSVTLQTLLQPLDLDRCIVLHGKTSTNDLKEFADSRKCYEFMDIHKTEIQNIIDYINTNIVIKPY
jgi:hypothetical protein